MFEKGVMKMELDVKGKLGKIIQINRKLKKMSQQKLSTDINYNQSVISKAENGNDIIQLSVYIKILNYLKLNYVYNESINYEINQLIEDVYQAFLFLNYEKGNELLEKITKCNQVNQNIIRYYDLLILELVIHFMMNNLEKSLEILKDIAPYYKICEKRCQNCFIYVNNYFHTIYNEGADITFDQLKLNYDLNQDDGFVDYIIGWNYYYEFNNTNALHYFEISIQKFASVNNYCRIIRCELLINEILLIDKNYRDVYERSLEFIEKVSLTKCYNDLNQLYFHAGYSLYYLEEYTKAKAMFEKIINEVDFSEHSFIQYMHLKCCDKLNEAIQRDLVNENNVLILLYFNKVLDVNYYQLIEKGILPYMDHQFFKIEYQIYSFQLLYYYWDTKKYRQYKKLNEKIYQLLHV